LSTRAQEQGTPGNEILDLLPGVTATSVETSVNIQDMERVGVKPSLYLYPAEHLVPKLWTHFSSFHLRQS